MKRMTCLIVLAGLLVGGMVRGEEGEKWAGVTYELRGADAWPADIRERITKAMDEAVAEYNKHARLRKFIFVTYDPGVPTAHANYNGHITFGKQIGTRTALHEMCHVFGVGTTRQWREKLVDGQWTGPAANELLKTFDGPDAVLKGDRQHFWPYGLNFDREVTENAFERHVKMVEALVADMDLPEGKPEATAPVAAPKAE